MNALLDYRFWLYLGLLLTFVYIVLIVLSKKSKRIRIKDEVGMKKLSVTREDLDSLKDQLKPSEEGNTRTIRFGISEDGEIVGELKTKQDIMQALDALHDYRRKAKTKTEAIAFTKGIQRLVFKLKDKEELLSNPDYVFSGKKCIEDIMFAMVIADPGMIKVMIKEIENKIEGKDYTGSPVENTWFTSFHGARINELNLDVKVCAPEWIVPRSELQPLSLEEILAFLKKNAI